MSDEVCSVTRKPKRFCCVGDPWTAISDAHPDKSGYGFFIEGEPLDPRLIDAGLRHSVNPHALESVMGDRGWETHDAGYGTWLNNRDVVTEARRRDQEAAARAIWQEHNDGIGGFKDTCVCVGCRMAVALGWLEREEDV